MSSCKTKLQEVGPLVVKPREARVMLACGNTRLYKLIAEHELESFLDGRSRKITVESIRRYISRRLPATDSANTQSQPLGRRRDRSAGQAVRIR
jgi:hypothetical protein